MAATQETINVLPQSVNGRKVEYKGSHNGLDYTITVNQGAAGAKKVSTTLVTKISPSAASNACLTT